MARDGHEDIPRLKADRLAYACQLAGITPEDAKGPSQVRTISNKRFHVMSLLKSWGASYTEIGRRLNRSHPAIMYGVHKWDAGDIKSNYRMGKPKPDGPHEKYISWNGHTYSVQIRIEGKKRYFGSTKSIEEARAIRAAALKGIPRK